jgi:hypothetical protein
MLWRARRGEHTHCFMPLCDLYPFLREVLVSDAPKPPSWDRNRRLSVHKQKPPGYAVSTICAGESGNTFIMEPR